MDTYLLQYLDLVVVAGLLVVCVFVLGLVKLNYLPRKSLWFVVGAGLGVVGITVANRLQKQALLKELAVLDERIKKRDKELEAQREAIVKHDKLYSDVKAEYEKAREAYQRNIMVLDAKTQEEKQRRAALPDQDLFDEFDKVFGQGSKS